MNSLLCSKLAFCAIIIMTVGVGITATATAPGPVGLNLGTAGDYVILAKTGISTTGNTAIAGDIGVSPAAASYITGFALMLPAASPFSTSAKVTGKVYASGYANPTPTNLTTAILNMQTAFAEGVGRAPGVTELGAGNIGGMTLAPNVYKWSTGLLIPTDITLSGGSNDIWIFQIAQNLTVNPGVKILLSGGAQARNVYWVVTGQTTIGTTAAFAGNILDQTAIVIKTGASLDGRALAQTAVTLDSNAVALSTQTDPSISTSNCPLFTPPAPGFCAGGTLVQGPLVNGCPSAPTCAMPVVCTMEVTQCPDGSYVGRGGTTCAFKACPAIKILPSPAIEENQTLVNENSRMAALQVKIAMIAAEIRSLTEQRESQSRTPASPLNFGQLVRSIASTLVEGNNSADVSALQHFLIMENKGTAALALAKVGATSYFGVLTRAALAEYQANVGISPSLGNFGPITRAYIRMH